MAPPPLTASSGSLHPASVQRWGEVGLWGALVGGIALTLVFVWWAPKWAILAPLVPAAIWTAGWLFTRPFANLVVLLSGFVVTLNTDSGLQAPEIAYGLYLYAFLFVWYTKRLLSREDFVLTKTDWIAAFLLVFGVGGGFTLGLLFGAPLGGLRGETTAFAMLALYFPVKEACRQERRGAELLLAVAIWVGLFVALRNLLNFREIILSATEAWEVSDARPGLNEMQILIPLLGVLVLLLYVRGRLRQLGMLALFLILTGALIMTKARGYWIDFIFGFGVLFLLLEGRYKWRLLTLTVVGAAGTIAVAFVFFGNVADLIFSGTIERFSTLQTALTEDVSLVNRFHETSVVWSWIERNPILGYGFGTQFRFFDWVYRATFVKSFMHNGYTALWFKIGIWGLTLMMLLWIAATWQGWKTYKNQHVPLMHRLIALSMALTLIAIIPSVSTSNPFIVIHQMYTFTLQLGVAVGLYQRYTLGAEPGVVHDTVPREPDVPVVRPRV